LEACGQELAQTSAKLNIATLCYAGGN
jgi:hypothetical protein